MSIDLDEAKDRAERGLLLTARHGEALLDALKRAQAELALFREREPLVQELCDYASEAREFFGEDLDEADAYALKLDLLETERAVREFAVGIRSTVVVGSRSTVVGGVAETEIQLSDAAKQALTIGEAGSEWLRNVKVSK